MQIFSRWLQLARSNWTHWVTQNQDPEQVLEQTIQHLQDDMIQLRQSVAQAIATYKRTERQCRQNRQRADDWYAQAETAMANHQEAAARDALSQRQLLLSATQALEAQLETQQTIIHKLKQDLSSLDLKLTDARTRKDLYLVRVRSAQATQRMNDMLGRLNRGSGPGMFESMEQRAIDLEAKAQASQELENLPQDPLERQFAALEQMNVEDELEVLRRRFHD